MSDWHRPLKESKKIVQTEKITKFVYHLDTGKARTFARDIPDMTMPFKVAFSDGELLNRTRILKLNSINNLTPNQSLAISV